MYIVCRSSDGGNKIDSFHSFVPLTSKRRTSGLRLTGTFNRNCLGKAALNIPGGGRGETFEYKIEVECQKKPFWLERCRCFCANCHENLMGKVDAKLLCKLDPKKTHSGPNFHYSFDPGLTSNVSVSVKYDITPCCAIIFVAHEKKSSWHRELDTPSSAHA